MFWGKKLKSYTTEDNYNFIDEELRPREGQQLPLQQVLIQQVLTGASRCADHSGMKMWLHPGKRGKSTNSSRYLGLFSHVFHFVVALDSL